MANATTCDPSTTTLGYAPNKPLNVILAAAYAFAALPCLYFGFTKHTKVFGIVVAFGCVLEAAGYVGRAMLHDNPCSNGSFQLQIVAIILAPTFISAALYLLLKHFIRAFNEDISRIRAKWFPIIFVPADVTCLVIQGAGGGIASSGSGGPHRPPDERQTKAGGDIMIAGIALQVAVLVFFGIVCLDYILRLRKWIHTAETMGVAQWTAVSREQKEAAGLLGSGLAGDGTRSVTPRASATDEAKMAHAVALWRDKRFKLWFRAMITAYAVILIRSIYRLPELASGWGSTIMQDEVSFVVLESFMVLIGCWLLAAFPPGIFFPQMSRKYVPLYAA